MRYSLVFLAATLLLLSAYAGVLDSSAQLPLVGRPTGVPNWQALTVLGLMISALFIAVSFAIGEAGQFASVKAFARAELYELAVSILLVVLITGGLMAFGLFAQRMAAGTLISGGVAFVGYCSEESRIYDVHDAAHPENALFATTDWFLGCMPDLNLAHFFAGGAQGDTGYRYNPNAPSAYTDVLQGQSKGVLATHLMNIYVSLASLELLLGPVSTFGVSFYLPEGLLSHISVDSAPNAGLTPISESTIMLTDLIGVGLGAIFMQKVLLKFMYLNALSVFLPMGIAFRAIPFLRKTGSTIIAIVLIGYFIFPLSIWANEQVYFMLQKPEPPSLIPWANYHSLLQACTPAAGASVSEIRQMVQKVETDVAAPFQHESKSWLANIWDKIWGRPQDILDPTERPENLDVTLPGSQMSVLRTAFVRNIKTILNYLAHPLFFPIPGGSVIPTSFFYQVLADQITASMQWFALSLLFLVNTILICVTLFRDISLAIGGEPRIFGMGKLV